MGVIRRGAEEVKVRKMGYGAIPNLNYKVGN
jgi:hypothetical protein